MDKYFNPDAVAAAKKHAIRCYPEESVGVILEGNYVPLDNVGLDPSMHEEGNPSCACRRCSFRLSSNQLLEVSGGRKIDVLIHSHPDGPLHPSHSDMEAQLNMNVPWGIIATDGARASEIVAWGDDLPMEPLVGRKFIHGVHDCYALIRDIFRLGSEGAAVQGIEWPFEPILLPNVPRQDEWWMNGQDLYMDYLYKAGFREIPMSEARSGDGFLMKLGRPKPPVVNHAGVLTGDYLVLHHMPGATRVSRREPVGGWGRTADLWVRFYPELMEKNW